jgi:prolyl 4-hydroxylase
VWHNQACHDFHDLVVFENGEHTNGKPFRIQAEDCRDITDLGTVLNKLHNCVSPNGAKRCDVFTHLATRVSTCADLSEGVREVYLVPERRNFMWPTKEIGHKVEVSHIHTVNGKPITLETLSHHPRVFRLSNFFTEEEADGVIRNALAIKDPAIKLKRSTTGAIANEKNPFRTSENAFDSTSPLSIKLKQRCFQLLGIHPYQESWSDGLQVLRYNQSKAYIPHLDWMDAIPGEHDWHSWGKGTNRFATIFMYLSDVEEGGETVFTEAWPTEERVSLEEALEDADRANATSLFEEGSWERKMVAQCRSRLAVKPKKGDAVLFYSQHPDGRVDRMSIHGGCPVIKGTKWGANLWVWNGPRYGLSKRREDGWMEPLMKNPDTVHATFETMDLEGVSLMYAGSEFTVLQPGQPVHINTYEGHKWEVRKNGQLIKQWLIEGHPSSQVFRVSRRDVTNQDILDSLSSEARAEVEVDATF